MCSTTDGFILAEEDMKMRGAGDIEGTTQSGLAIDLKIASIGHDNKLLELARQAADTLLQEDPSLILPKNEILNIQLAQLKKSEKYGNRDFSLVS